MEHSLSRYVLFPTWESSLLKILLVQGFITQPYSNLIDPDSLCRCAAVVVF